MKKLIVAISVTCVVSLCNAQTPVNKDTIKLDSAQIEKISKMPMDSMHHTMPIYPKSPKDSLYKPKTIDDADPKKPKSPNPKL
ncbi:MAG: hypothetical protein ABI723_07865 [Bacteroidia bacterium]